MGIAFVTQGASAVGTTSLAVPNPATPVSGNLFLLGVVDKYPTNAPTVPTGYALVGQLSGGSGSAGVDAGSVYSSVYSKISDGLETGSLTVTIASGNGSIGRTQQYSCTAGTWIIDAITGADNVAGVDYAITFATPLGWVQNGDLLLTYTGVNTDVVGSWSAISLTGPGVAFSPMTSRSSGGTAQGDDMGVLLTEHYCTAGSSTGPLTYRATANTSITDGPAGASVLVRLRQTTVPAGFMAGPILPLRSLVGQSTMFNSLLSR